MKQHLIALDLDGTLLTENHKITIRTKKIIKQLQNDGHIVVIATGRPFHSSEPYYHELNLTTPIINHNGAYMHTPTNNNARVIHEKLDREITLSILQALNKNFDLLALSAERINEVYLQKTSPIFDMLYGFGSPKIISGNIYNKMVDAPVSILLHTKENETKAIHTFLGEQYGDYIEHRCWGMPTTIIEITKKGINKATTLQTLAKQYDVPPERIMAFGDQDNDLEMLAFAGIGVAVANADPAVKSVANYITDSNENDGVANFLEKYFSKVPC